MAAFEARPTEAHKAIIAQLLRDDAELQGIAREYVKLGMYELLRQLQAGDAATRAAIAKSLSRVVTAAITEGAEDDGDQTLRAEMHEMMAEMRGDLMDAREVIEKKAIVKKSR